MNGQRRTWAHENEIRAWHDTHYAHTSPETKRSAWQHFANLQDPYNTGNFMTGWVQMIGGDEYGNLVIESCVSSSHHSNSAGPNRSRGSISRTTQ